VHLLGSEALGDVTNNVAEYTAVRNALRAAADAGAMSAHVRMDSPMVFGHLSGASRARAEHLIQLKEEVEAQVARYPGRVTFARIPRERNGVADELAKDGARGLEGAERRSAAIGSASSARPSARSGRGSTRAVTLARAPLPYPRSTGPVSTASADRSRFTAGCQ
jgi:ribonuclease HI